MEEVMSLPYCFLYLLLLYYARHASLNNYTISKEEYLLELQTRAISVAYRDASAVIIPQISELFGCMTLA